MKISSNQIKKYIKNSEDIDFLHVWDIFTIRTAEVEGVEIKGQDLKDVVVAEIVTCENHPTKEKYHVLKVTDGKKEYSILCGAPNVRVGLKAPLVKVGGMVSGITIEEKKIAGVLSEGMLCAMDELGIGSDHAGILELPSDAVLGTDIHDLYPINDIVVEIDNKSLTNRPDLWGHYGIAREIAAITNHELLPLDVLEIENNQDNLDIVIKNPELCFRYCGLRIGNITNNVTPIDMQVFLHYVGMRSISLIVDLTNFLMLELGQPMHAFDGRVVKNIEVGLADKDSRYTTLDGVERILNENVLVIKNANKYFGIAGIMGGLDSEILNDTNEIVLESATFDATSIRKTATSLGLRTEASARYEKSLDPEMAILAAKRFAFLLKKENPELRIESNLTDIYLKKYPEVKITLKKAKLRKYIDKEIDNKVIINILTSLGFVVNEEDEAYIIDVPSYRATKDVTMDADIIEEISRMYGYENIELKPLKLDLTFKEYENVFGEEYEIKKLLASLNDFHEVNSYLWYDASFLKENNIEKSGVSILNNKDKSLLRDDLSLSLLPFVRENFKNYSSFNLFEIGTIIKNNENKRSLSILLCSSLDKIQENYKYAKEVIETLFKKLKNVSVNYEHIKNDSYYDEKYSLAIRVNDDTYGSINTISNKVMNSIAKKKSIVTVSIDIDKFLLLEKRILEFKEINKYPENELDYTIISDANIKYETIEKIINAFKDEYIVDKQLIDIYKAEKVKYTIRFKVGSREKTLTQAELNMFKNNFIKYIKENALEIIE